MFDTIKISVDGQDGDLVARNNGIRFVTPDDDLALVRRDQSRDGQPGANASRATPGAPAGLLAVELLESSTTEEGITVRTVGFESREQPPPWLEVPARRNIVLSAVGGRGESGHRGGNGQAGMDGIDGFPATREVDATRGTDGGNGGDAGRGSNGADGGDGGIIEVCVNEDNTHLLFAAQWNVQGGEAGASGHHGQPGQGGRGGAGGAGHKWRELVGYGYHCTVNCIGHIESSTSTSLVRVGSVVGSKTMALMAPIRAQAVEGGNLQAMLASVAQRYGARRHERVDPGSCHCKGGTGNCYGCRSVPIHKDFERVPGGNGRDGRPGLGVDTPLFAGSAGQAGNATIYVRFHDGSQQQYDSCYQLELLDFDVADENGDGIFEPGEHVFIRRIRVRNTGGMPSPKCLIPISVVPSDWFLPVSGAEGYTLIPSSITPGISITLEGSIKVLIQRSADLPVSGSQFFRSERLSVRATMPWLNWNLPHFEYSRVLDIQYPVELRRFDFLPSLAQGSTSQFTFEMLNRSAKALGDLTYSRRHVEAQISFPEDFGVLLSSQDVWENQVDCRITELPAQESVPMRQKLRIIPDAQNYQHVAIQVGLYISVPSHDTATQHNQEVNLQLIQQNDLVVQISAYHTFNKNSSFLLVTNSRTSRDQVQTIQYFINNELNMQMDEWNVSLHGGLQFPPESVAAPPDYVLGLYRGKTIIFMGNQFEYFNSGTRNACEICDPRILSQTCVHGTGCLFLESSGQEAFRNLARSVVLPVPHRINNIFENQKASHSFVSKSAMLESLSQHKIVSGSPEIVVYTIPVKRRRYKLWNKAWPEAEAKKLAKFLRQRLPQERFLVTAARHGVATQSENHIIVLHGVPHLINFAASETRPKGAELSHFEAFIIADSLPISTRVDITWSLPANDTPSSPLAFEAIVLSLLLSINTEIRTFLHKANWPNAIKVPPTNSDTDKQQAFWSFLLIHLPILSQFLQHPTAQAPDPVPKHILELLTYTLASCWPQKKRHVLAATALPFAQRRTQLRKAILPIIDGILSRKSGNNAGFLTEFHKQVKTLRSKVHDNGVGGRDTRRLIMRAVGEFTRMSSYGFEHGRMEAGRVVERTEFCGAEEWNRRWEGVERMAERVRVETRGAWDDLRGKLVG